MPEVVQAVVEQAQAKTETAGRVLGATWDLTWDKILHLIFLPLLAATRPWQLRYTLGSGLLGICQTAYRFETIQRVLGELAHARVGTPLRYGFCRVWVETLVGLKLPLHLYIDVHLKPHWTQIFMPCGHVAMLNRVMPCTRQIIVTNPQGYVWEILDQVGDAHLSHDLPAVEEELEQVTRHPVTLTIVDREANGLKVAQMYTKSRHFALLTLLDDPVAGALIFGTPQASEIFQLTGRWQPLLTERGMSLAPAVWGSARMASTDPRVFWLVRQDATNSLRAAYSLSQPVADCAPDAAALLHGSGARAVYRARWPAMEGVIREMIAGANLNENYGYEVYEVPNRLRQRQFEEAAALVGVTQTQLDHVQEQITQAQTHLTERVETLVTHQAELAEGRVERETEQQARQQAGQATRRIEQQLAALERQSQILNERVAHLTERAATGPLAKLNGRQGELAVKLVERQAAAAAIDLDSTDVRARPGERPDHGRLSSRPPECPSLVRRSLLQRRVASVGTGDRHGADLSPAGACAVHRRPGHCHVGRVCRPRRTGLGRGRLH